MHRLDARRWTLDARVATKNLTHSLGTNCAQAVGTTMQNQWGECPQYPHSRWDNSPAAKVIPLLPLFILRSLNRIPTYLSAPKTAEITDQTTYLSTLSTPPITITTMYI